MQCHLTKLKNNNSELTKKILDFRQKLSTKILQKLVEKKIKIISIVTFSVNSGAVRPKSGEADRPQMSGGNDITFLTRERTRREATECEDTEGTPT